MTGPRLFLALWPPADVVDMLMAVPRKDQRGVRFVRPDNWHITLRFLGAADESAVAAAMAAVDLPAATARLGPAVDVFAERVLVIPVNGIDELAQAVIGGTARLGEHPPRRYISHLTIAQINPASPMPAALGTFVTAEFGVTEVALVHSELRRHGPRYETLQTWPVPGVR